jgi:hypothetical protein
MVCHLRIHNVSNDGEELYKEKHLELIAAQGASTGTAHFITGKLPSFQLIFKLNLTAHCVTRLTITTSRQTSMIHLIFC